MTKDAFDFERFMKTRAAAAQAYVQGESAPLEEIVTRKSPASFFGPQGGHHEGAQAVSSTYTHDAEAFEPGGESHFEILDQSVSNGVAYWVGFQRAKVKMRGRAEPIAMDLRVTELFRREGEEWKLVHRHADSMVETKSK
jgi:ketosteroid isomerase-like protein